MVLPQPLSIAGLAVLAAGIGWLALVPADGSFVTDVLPATIVAAVGMSLPHIPVTMAALAGAALIAAAGAVASLALVHRRRQPASVDAAPDAHAGQPA